MRYVGIVGTRRRDGKEGFAAVQKAFHNLVCMGIPITIVSGGCKQGGDRFAEEIAIAYNLELLVFPPNRNRIDRALLEKNPRAAYTEINYARNRHIAQMSDWLIACVAPDRKGGTEDTIKHFKRVCKDRGWDVDERLVLV